MQNSKSIRNSFLTVQTLASANSVSFDNGTVNANGQFTGSSSTGGFYEFLEFGASQSLVATNNVYNSISPYTVEFTITKTVSDSQSAEIRLFNVSPARRRALLHPIWTVGVNQYIKFQAGYGFGFLPVAFSGYVQHCTETREGVNTVLNFSCTGSPNALPIQISGTATGNAQQNIFTVLNQGAAQFNSSLPANAPKIRIGAVGKFTGDAIVTQNYSDNLRNVIASMTNTPVSCFTISDNFLYALNYDEYITNLDLATIDSSTGLLGSPNTDGTVVELEMLFEPRFKVFQGVDVKTNFNPYINGFYKVQSITHQGVISPAVGGTATTKVTLWAIPQPQLQAASIQSFSNVA